MPNIPIGHRAYTKRQAVGVGYGEILVMYSAVESGRKFQLGLVIKIPWVFLYCAYSGKSGHMYLRPRVTRCIAVG